MTGGGVVDGLLFHFRKSRTTVVRRRVGISPKLELELELEEAKNPLVESVVGNGRTEHATRGDAANDNDQQGQPGGRGEGGTARLVEKVPGTGDEMTWRHIPSPQVGLSLSLTYIVPC